MRGHDAATLAVTVASCAVFGILLVMVFRGIWSLSKATPVTANEAPAPARTAPPRRPARRSRDRHEIELLPADAIRA
jgi:hypothetical protein